MSIREYHPLLAGLESDSSLFEPDQMARRLDILDELDACLAENCTGQFIKSLNQALACERINEIKMRLEAVNSAIYRSIRDDLRKGSPDHQLLRWIQACGDHKRTSLASMGYDQLDELVSGVFQFPEPEPANNPRKPEMVFYQPTPVRHILDFIQLSHLGKDDILIDLGSGLGHVPLLATILTGTRSIGIEADPAYIKSARSCARALVLGRVAFVQQDATHADLSSGTVYYMYTPFTGTMLQSILRKLRNESVERTIRICTLGPCTPIVATEPWLKATGQPGSDRITCFQSNP